MGTTPLEKEIVYPTATEEQHRHRNSDEYSQIRRCCGLFWLVVWRSVMPRMSPSCWTRASSRGRGWTTILANTTMRSKESHMPSLQLKSSDLRLHKMWPHGTRYLMQPRMDLFVLSTTSLNQCPLEMRIVLV